MKSPTFLQLVLERAVAQHDRGQITHADLVRAVKRAINVANVVGHEHLGEPFPEVSDITRS